MYKVYLIFIVFSCNNINTNEDIYDCLDIKNGTAVIDQCGICNGTGIEEGFCDCQHTMVVDICGNCNSNQTELINCEPPNLFNYNQSTLQAFYFIENVVIKDKLIAQYDWVGIFKDNICVGSRIWNTNECGNNVCDLPAMGNNGDNNTIGYLNEGDLPLFKIYDKSENKYFHAIPSSNIHWTNLNLVYIDSLIAIIE